MKMGKRNSISRMPLRRSFNRRRIYWVSLREVKVIFFYFPLINKENRHYASTMMNHASSRSHTIFRLYIQSMSIKNIDGTTEIAESILNFVDLAGSEKINIHDGMRTKKAQM